MKMMHLADLHLGKRVNGYSLTMDQKYILKKTLEIADEEKIDVCLLAGDIYDRSIPPVDAVKLLNDFLRELEKRKILVMMISGNHDSAERLAFANELLEKTGVYVSYPYDGSVRKVECEDQFGEVYFYLLPFIKPVHVKKALEIEEIDSYTKAVSLAVEKMNVDKTKRNVILSHQFVTGSTRSESEDINIGGVDNVDVSAYIDFDYVALGHLHKAQQCIDRKIRYSGTLLAYEFGEGEKTVTLVDLKGKGDLEIKKIPLKPEKKMRVIKGTFKELIDRSSKSEENAFDYIRAILLDEEDVPDAYYRLKAHYPNIMQMMYENTRTKIDARVTSEEISKRLSPIEYASNLYEKQNNKGMTKRQKEILVSLLEEGKN